VNPTTVTVATDMTYISNRQEPEPMCEYKPAKPSGPAHTRTSETSLAATPGVTANMGPMNAAVTHPRLPDTGQYFPALPVGLSATGSLPMAGVRDTRQLSNPSRRHRPRSGIKRTIRTRHQKYLKITSKIIQSYNYYKNKKKYINLRNVPLGNLRYRVEE
jgi:hypothetical protein